MEALTQMFAYGWPLALAGFVIGVFASGWATRKAEMAGDKAVSSEQAPRAPESQAPDLDSLAALAEELAAAKALLNAEEQEGSEFEEALKTLDEAVKRANGRLKLVSKAINPPK